MADQKYCRNCGAPNQPTAIFCANCGATFARAATLPQTAPLAALRPLSQPRRFSSGQLMVIGIVALFLVATLGCLVATTNKSPTATPIL